MSKFFPYFEIELPREYKPEQRKAIASDIIDLVISRTESGYGVSEDGKEKVRFAKYSPKYAKEKGQKNVDLTFSGEMLSEIQLLQEKAGKIRIGYDSDYEGLGKVRGNVLGTYGNDEPVTKPRNFLGITEKELKNILANYPLDDKEALDEAVETRTAAEYVARQVVAKGKVDVRKPEDDE